MTRAGLLIVLFILITGIILVVILKILYIAFVCLTILMGYFIVSYALNKRGK
jgi:hypothetical protein